MPLRVLLADDHNIVRQGLKALLQAGGFDVVGEAVDGQQAVQLAEALTPDVAVLDVVMPVLNGLDAARAMLRARPRLGVILLTANAEDHQIVAALRAGIRGYMVKTQAAEELVQAIHQVARGDVYLSPDASRFFVDAYLTTTAEVPDPLSDRERQVLQLVAEGNTSKEIASILGLSVKSAESYRTRIMDKLDIHDTAGLVRYAIRRGIIKV